MIYRLINKSDNKITQYRKEDEIFIYLLGRRISNYILIKSDDSGDRVINIKLPTDRNAYTSDEFREELRNN